MDAQAIASGDRRALSRAVTLIESTRPEHRKAAAALLDALAPLGRRALRIGLTGTPGVGKSTFVEALGMALIERGLSVAVLAVDPSSARTGGSILGDKTRMERLARHPRAFVRPSPAARELGGVARRTREAAALLEGAGFDVLVIETVGVGQSETAVAEVSDLFALLIAPGGGDELQGVKRGIMEAADLVLVNKADGPLAEAARRTRGDYAAALRLMRRRPDDPEGFPRALSVSAATGDGLEEAWDAMRTLHEHRRDTGALERRRAAQAARWFEEEVRRGLLDRALADPTTTRRMEALLRKVATGATSPAAAAMAVLAGVDSADPDP
jgi:LAO/AO transport system kinase